MLSPSTASAVGTAGLVLGVAIGCTSIGGVLLVPFLIYAAVASVTNLRAGRVDVVLGTFLAVTLSIGIVVGTPLAHALPQMVISGMAMGVRLILGWTLS